MIQNPLCKIFEKNSFGVWLEQCSQEREYGLEWSGLDYYYSFFFLGTTITTGLVSYEDAM